MVATYNFGSVYVWSINVYRLHEKVWKLPNQVLSYCLRQANCSPYKLVLHNVICLEHNNVYNLIS